jgi:hypothetical protein
MKRRDFLKLTTAVGAVTVITPTGIVQAMGKNVISSLEDSFLNPTNTAKPGNMWFWMNGQVTKQGITLDLEAMARVGIGAVFNFDAGTGIPKGPLQYLSPEWFDMKAHALKECARLNIDFCMHNCPGWSSSGGPWITPELSMKTLTWSETYLTEDAPLSMSLPKPPTKLDFYQDVVVLAFPSLPKGTSRFADWEKRTNKEFNRGLKEIVLPPTPEGSTIVSPAPGAIPPNGGTNSLPSGVGGSVIDKNSIFDVSKFMNTEGVFDMSSAISQLTTHDPRLKTHKDWTIVRFGFTSLATENRSAPDSGIGLECDKFDPQAVAFHFDKMMAALLPAVAPLAKKGKMGLEIDSWEIGMQNWTAGFENEFEKRNGYSLINYLPTMTGSLVGDADTTERFLWDLRRTQADILADNYYGKMADLCHQHQITAYFEPYDRGPMEELQIGSRADTVMGEYWNGLSAIFQNNLTMKRTCKLASSIAHISGQKIVGVEGLTGEPESAKWQEYAFAMKPICDKIFTMGINRILIHRNAHQPHPTAVPGMTMGPWGIQFDRTNTMWEVNRAWLAYLTRCQSLLQQGLFVADLAYFTGEDAGTYTKVNVDELNPAPTEGYDYDVINAETLLKKAKMVDNRLVLPDGMSYKVLVLQKNKAISLGLLAKIQELVNNGLILIGSKPETMTGLIAHNADVDKVFKEKCFNIWGNDETALIDRKVGKGRVFWGQTLSEILETIDLKLDFEATLRSNDAPIKFIHRKTAEADFYFVCNQRRTNEDLVCSFRITGKKPELWDANTGKMLDAPVFEVNEGRTHVALSLQAYGSVFVVFRDNNIKTQLKSITKENALLMNVGFRPPIVNLDLSTTTNNFSISFWAKPEYNAMMTDKGFFEGVKHAWTDFYAIYPTAGESLYGYNHAIAGVTVGRNGVAIWENTEGMPVFNFAATTLISGWSHISVVYTEGVPSVYVNGVFIKKGEKKTVNVHPAHSKTSVYQGASYFNGDMTEPTLWNEVLSAAKIKELAANKPSTAPIFDRIVENTEGVTPSLLFWQNGNYELTDNKNKTTKLSIINIEKSYELTGSWALSFPKNTGAPEKITLLSLISLKNHENDGVKYFSGTATYRKSLSISKSTLEKGKRLFMDLGEVEVIAEVLVNGQNLGIYWTRPYLIDITEAIKVGINAFEIRVTNQWVNRLIGDEQLPEVDKYVTKGEGSPFAPLVVGAIEELPEWYKKGEPKPNNGRVTFTTWKHHKKDAPLLESGLIGPVVLRMGVVAKL